MAVEGESVQSPGAMTRVTWEGCSVLLDINDGDRLVFARLSPAASVKIGKKKLPLRPLVGCPFGSLFQVEVGPKGPYLAQSRSETASAMHLVKENGHSKDNRALVDDNTAQRLSGEDIDAMRREGATGNEIIEALIANSATFDKKTMFSQEKYRVKKQKKFAPKVLVRRPSTWSICEAYFKKYPSRIGYLRVDTLSLLLSCANVSGYSDVLVLDKVGGMVTGAVAERLGSAGKVCCTYFGTTPYPLSIVKIFNFGADLCSRILQAPFSMLSSAQDKVNRDSKSNLNIESSEIPNNSIPEPLLKESVSLADSKLSSKEESLHGETSHVCSDLETTCADDSSSSTNIDGVQQISMSSLSRIRKSSNPGRHAPLETVKLWKENGFTSLIVAAPELDIENIVPELLPLLAYSAPFAVYHQYLQPLAACMHKLQTTKLAVGLQISEPWLREYQVLPSRTHPHMQMSGLGGYMLSGIRTCSSDPC